jgi:hypothetical protein
MPFDPRFFISFLDPKEGTQGVSTSGNFYPAAPAIAGPGPQWQGRGRKQDVTFTFFGRRRSLAQTELCQKGPSTKSRRAFLVADRDPSCVNRAGT